MKKLKKIVPVIGLLLFIAVVTNTAMNTKAEEAERIADGVFIGSVDVGGMTAQEAESAIEAYVAEVNQTVFTLAADDRTLSATAEELGVSFDDTNVVSEAMDVCKNGNLIKRYKDQKDLENGNKVISLTLAVDETAVETLLTENADELNIEAVNNGLVRKDGEFQYIEGNSGVEINIPDSILKIEDYLSNQWDGLDATIELAAEIVEPEGTLEDLQKVKDILGTYNTSYSSSSAARCTNISVAAGKIDGTVLYPGEEFSVYDCIGPMDASNGYELAGAYENGQTVEAYGGGVCQVSTTLYNAAILAELEITQRSNHSMIVSYVDPSRDAAIAGDYKNLRFVNNTEAPVYIEAYTVGKTLYFNIFGEETRDSKRTVSYESEVISQEDPVTQFVATGDPIGYAATVQSKHIGYVARLWKIVTVAGVEESREIFNKSTYKASPKIVNIGTAAADPNASAAVNAAIATQDEATIYATINQYTQGGTVDTMAPSTPADNGQTSSNNEGMSEEASSIIANDDQITVDSESTDGQ